MIYNVTINDKVYEVEVEKGKANLLKTTAVQAAPAPVAAAPVAAPAAPAPAAAPAVVAGGTPVPAPLPGTILKVNVTEGQAVKEGDLLVVLEAMKMENEIYAPCAGKVAQILVSKGSSVNTDDVLVTIA